MIEVDLNKIIEALLFVSENPLTIKQISEVCPNPSPAEIKKVLKDLQEHYSAPERGMQIIEVAGGYQFCSHPDCEPYLSKLYKTRRVFRLSAPALESLAIIAYKQPVTRAEMEFIRGVNVDGVIKNLEERELIKTKGRKEVAGRPMLYGTTEKFLHYFGLKSLQDLPSLEEFAATALEKEAQIKQEQDEANEQNVPESGTEPQTREMTDSDANNDPAVEDLDVNEDAQRDNELEMGMELAENSENIQEAADEPVSSDQVQTQRGDACHEQDEHTETAKSN
ncbi:MAG: SMC-Scp complex subunit ScpB [Candidatus Omnitrophota bacterium]